MSKQQDLDEQYIRDYEEEIRAAKLQGAQSQNAFSAAMFGSPDKQNLVEWQLDFKPELQDIERALRNDVLVYDEKSKRNEWKRNPDQSKILLNDLGVSDIMKKILLLINKNKVLSNYREEQIHQRLRYICHAIRELIYLNYEEYGMDNDYKWNCFYSLVIDIDDMVESAYRRALNGEERRDLNQARVVQQNEPLMGQQYNPYSSSSQQRGGGSKFNPFNWFKR